MNHKVAVVTGSGRKRVGNAVARGLAVDGYSVAIHYHRSESDAMQTVAEMNSAGVTASAFSADVAREEEVESMFAEILQQFGRIDVLVNAASIWRTIPLETVTAADIQENFGVDTLGTFLCSRRAGLVMADQQSGGSIITISDWAIERPNVDHAAYFIAKGSIPTLTRMLAVELGRRNPQVRVNCISPGPVLFPPDTSPEQQQMLIDSTLVKSGDCPEAIVQAVRFLIKNKFVTGVCLPVDGGRSIFTPEQFSDRGV